MINNLLIKTPVSSWRSIQRSNFTQWDQLAEFLQLNAEQRQRILVNPSFILNLPKRLAEKIQKSTLDDPILKQFVPLKDELVRTDHFRDDPVGDTNCLKAPKLLHKYEGRVLLVVTSACAMHCRYCFRQNFNYDSQKTAFEEELALIAADDSIHEVILSGGDPLSLSNEQLGLLLFKIDAIKHVQRIRFHSRFPVGIPERIDEDLLKILQRLSKQVWFVIHTNHAKELDETFFEAMKKIQVLGIPVLNQSVLLRGVNDSLEVLKELFEKLVDHGIFPYYLHQLDRVQGAQHFEVAEEKGIFLIEELRKCLPGYAVPKYVKEIYSEPSKTPI